MRTPAAVVAALLLATSLSASTPTACKLGTVMPPSTDTGKFDAALRTFLTNRCYEVLKWEHDPFVRDTGPWIGQANYGTHPAVRVWYSPAVYSWMKLSVEDRKKKPVQDGGIIVKEMFNPPAAQYSVPPKPGDTEGWTVMVREAAASQDGWYWSSYFSGADADSLKMSNTKYPSSGFGNYCVNCHASAQAESTFAAIRNVKGHDVLTYVNVTPSMADPSPQQKAQEIDLHRAKALRAAGPPLLTQPPSDNRLLELLAPWWKAADPLTYRGFPGETWDHVMAGKNGPPQFVTSDQCIGCHDATGNIQQMPANMIYPATANATTLYNLSPYGEWRASLMGLAGRDPVFHAQIASEQTIHANAKLPTTIANICFRCHGAMGQRQLAIDTAGKKAFVPEMVYAWQPTTAQPKGDARYGALAREGISCAVCHHISDKNLGEPKTYTGQFETTSPKTIVGPFTQPQDLPMHQSLGMTPVHAEYTKSSKLCGTCHTIQLPVLNANGEQVGEDFEQTTYFEWQNSAFQDERKPVGAQAQTCQQCHMPSTFKLKGFQSQQLEYRIANIEDNTYPYTDNHLPDPKITLQNRQEYARHTLVGINLFVQEMFLQFDEPLGIRTEDPMVWPPSSNASFVEGLKLAEQSTIDLARLETAKVEVLSANRTATDLEVTVRVTNNAGHSFPSGVSFRRAFLDFEVNDSTGKPIWASGATNDFGMITNGVNGDVLPTEFLDGEAYQPHFTTIENQSQAQIYEELVKDTEGHFTTSFLSLANKIKTNRILPRGWKPDGPHADATKPHGNAATDPDYLSGCGCDTITYKVPLAQAANAASVSAKLFYQTIPPYYLRQRFTDTHVPGTNTAAENTQRLMDFVRQLNTTDTQIKRWKLLIAGATRSLTP